MKLNFEGISWHSKDLEKIILLNQNFEWHWYLAWCALSCRPPDLYWSTAREGLSPKSKHLETKIQDAQVTSKL